MVEEIHDLQLHGVCNGLNQFNIYKYMYYNRLYKTF